MSGTRSISGLCSAFGGITSCTALTTCSYCCGPVTASAQEMARLPFKPEAERDAVVPLAPVAATDRFAEASEDTVTAIVQIKGKVRDRLQVPADITDEDLETVAQVLAGVVGTTGDAA